MNINKQYANCITCLNRGVFPFFIENFRILIFILFLPFISFGQEDNSVNNDSLLIEDLSGPGSVSKQLQNDSRNLGKTKAWYFLDSLDQAKKRFTEKTGFTIGLDYNSQIMTATEAIDNNTGASGVFRVYGKWNFVGRGTPHEGGLVFKVEHRHRYTENALREYGPLDVGFGGFVQSVYNNQGWRTTNLYWRQTLGTNKVVMYGGFVDVTDWTDVYIMASPWQGFNNLVFATGSGAMGGGYPDGAMGFMASAWLSDKIYAVGSIVDSNADPTAFWNGFDTFFTKFETVKTLEVGFTPNGLSSVFFKNIHITLWQVDERAEAQAPSGWGILGSGVWSVGDKFLPFLRFGWAQDGQSFYEYSISAGFGYNVLGPNTLGLGLNYNKPNPSTFGGADLDPQFVSEIFFKWKATHHSEFTPSIQMIANPAFNPGTNFSTIFALRGRIFL